jgi:protein O-GlcNAc transferase
MTDDEIAEFIRRREIDVIVDLTGLTQNNRFSVLSRRVAPIQVNFLGYPGTIGADWMDYIIADRTIIPPERLLFYSEQVVWFTRHIEAAYTTMWQRYQAGELPRAIAVEPID